MSEMDTNFLTTENELKELGTRKIGIASYPRCGNTLLRSLLESLSGIVTGSDSLPSRTLIKQLTESGFKGEGIVDDSVLFVKTHFPERLGHKVLNLDAVIVLIRNPFDAFVSYFNMVLTQSHSKTLETKEFERLSQVWDSFLAEESVIFSKFYAFWNDIAANQKIPIITIRFEDLTGPESQSETLEKVICFVENTLQDLHSSTKLISKMRSNLSTVAKKPVECLGKYIPRQFKSKSESSSFFKYTDHFSPTHIAFISTFNQNLLMKHDYWEQLSDLNLVSALTSYHEGNKSAAFVCKNDQDKDVVQLNSRHGIRPRTSDDPHARGFGTRWKTKLKTLSPLHIVDHEPFTFFS